MLFAVNVLQKGTGYDLASLLEDKKKPNYRNYSLVFYLRGLIQTALLYFFWRCMDPLSFTSTTSIDSASRNITW